MERGAGSLEGILDELRGIRVSLEKIAKTLPGSNREAFSAAVEEEVKRIFTSLPSSVHTHELYK